MRKNISSHSHSLPSILKAKSTKNILNKVKIKFSEKSMNIFMNKIIEILNITSKKTEKKYFIENLVVFETFEKTIISKSGVFFTERGSIEVIPSLNEEEKTNRRRTNNQIKEKEKSIIYKNTGIQKTQNFYFFEKKTEIEISHFALFWYLSHRKLLNFIEMIMNYNNFPISLLESDSIKQDYNKSILNKCEPIALLNEGDFSLVTLVKINNEYLIVKSYDKRIVQKYQTVQTMLNNIDLLIKIIPDSPFIMQNKGFYKEQGLYIYLYEYIKGMNFYYLLQNEGILSNQDLIFYSANLIIILDFLHSNNIIYRDLKPENIMIDQSGFLKLIDLETSKILNSELEDDESPDCEFKAKKDKNYNVRTYTLLGTPHYMAPEIIMGQGYDLAVDLWSLGIILYECICGYLPWGDSTIDENPDPFKIYEKINKKKLEFPEFVENEEVKNLIKKLLSKNKVKRENIWKIKKHMLFKNVDWKKIKEKNIISPKIQTNNDPDNGALLYRIKKKMNLMDFLRKKHNEMQ